MSFSVIPRPDFYTKPVEPYNTLLGLHQFSFNTNLICLIDKALNPSETDYSSSTKDSVDFISGFTSIHRFPGQPSLHLHKLATNLVPYSHMNLVLPGFFIYSWFV